MRGDRVVRLTLVGRCCAHEELEVACGRDAECPADLAFQITPAAGVRGLEVEELLDARGGHGDSLRAATDTTATIPRMEDYYAEPRCPACGTVMHRNWSGYVCRGCGHTDVSPWAQRPTGGDHLPGIRGG